MDSASTQPSGIPTLAPGTGSHVPQHTLHIVDLYSATNEDQELSVSDAQDKTVPFIYPLSLVKNPDGTDATTVPALFDEGAMTGAMSIAMFNAIKHKLHGWQPSTRTLRMANGATVRSEATWTGTIQVEDIKATGTFEVFNSQDGWSFLFGKPLLRAFKAIHDYATDHVTISDGTTVTILRNQYHSNDILRNGLYNIEAQKDITTTPEPNTTVFTRQTDPFAAPRVDYIVKNVQIGTDLTPGERKKVIDLLTEFADVFACSLSEVLPIPGANIDLNISEDVTLRTTVHQRPMNAPQRQFMSKWIDQMHSADLIEPADIPRIKHVAPTVLTQKTHEASGSMSLEDVDKKARKYISTI